MFGKIVLRRNYTNLVVFHKLIPLPVALSESNVLINISFLARCILKQKHFGTFDLWKKNLDLIKKYQFKFTNRIILYTTDPAEGNV